MANFPLSVTTFVTKNAGDTIQPADVNDLQNEINAIEAGYLNGTARLNSSNSTVNTLSLAGGQILFPATQASSTNRNTLDDYEEGTWTPVIGGDSGQSGQTYSNQSGFYVKVGKLVTAHCQVALTAKGTITGALVISGLPFISSASLSWGPAALIWQNMAAAWSSLTMYVVAGTTYAAVVGAHTADVTNLAFLGPSDITDTATFTVTLIYQAAA